MPRSSTRGPAPFHIYFTHTDTNTTGGGRVNLAIVTRVEPDEVRVVANPVAAGRTALGVRFGNDWYFTIHGLSGNGGDSAVLVDAIDTAVDSWNPAYTWTVGGDFNVDPGTLQGRADFPPGAYVHNSGRATQQAGGDLDYFVTNDPAANNVPTRR